MAISRFASTTGRPFLLLLLLHLILLLFMAIRLDVPLLLAVVACKTGVVLLTLLSARRFNRGGPSHIERRFARSLVTFFINDPCYDISMGQSGGVTGCEDGGGHDFIRSQQSV